MTSFITGAALAAVLATVTYFGLESLTVTQVERYDDRSVLAEDGGTGE